ncbi:FAD-dependent monooxygenase [Dictyobacter kobayashii]
MLQADEHEKDLLDDAAIVRCIRQALQTLPASSPARQAGESIHILRKTVYTFHATLATTFRADRIFLLGDAAHLMPPFGGQGMNSGLRDAYNLCWKIALLGQQDTSPRLLESYQQERQPHVTQMIYFSASLGAIIMPTQRALALLRDCAFISIQRSKPLRRWLAEMEVKPRPVYRAGFLLSGRSSGQLLPQPMVTSANGQRLPLDQLIEGRFCVFTLYEKQAEISDRFQGALWQRLKLQQICLCPTQEALELAKANLPAHISLIVDESGQLGRLWRHHPNQLLLTRPDCYILAAFHSSQLASIEGQLERYLFPTI